MKKIVLTVMVLCGVWTGTRTTKMDYSFGQSNTSLGIIPPATNSFGVPVTNQLGFTNTVVPAMDLSVAQVSDVSMLLLSLQTNMELTLPVLATLTSNATFVNFSTSEQNQGLVTPSAKALGGTLLSPTGAASDANAGQQTGVALTLGSNTFIVDQLTFQALLNLRDDLQRTLPLLQSLNGTTITNAGSGPPTFPTTGFSTTPLTNGFTTPLTNQPQILTAPSPF